MPRSAIVLFVKNEFNDISWWISYHFAIGVDTLIIYDDHSDDGTLEIIQSAKENFDIRIHKTNIEEQQDFYFRQRDSYLSAISTYGKEFDWMGFLDGDEYFFAQNDYYINDFLSQYENADAIAISWCIYGSGGHAFKPKTSPIEAYTTHSSIEFGDNCLVKTFLRPKKFGGNYIDPHRWDIDTNKYFSPSGNIVPWHGSTTPPQWDHAKILHYLCRSMENYLERIARRSDLYDSTNYWNHFDRNEIQDLTPLRYNKDIMLNAWKIYDTFSNKFLSNQLYKNKIESKKTNNNMELYFDCYTLISENEKFFCYDYDEKKIYTEDKSKIYQKNHLSEIIFFDIDINGSIVTVLTTNSESMTFIYINGSFLLSPLLPFEKHNNADGTVSFSSTISGSYLSANPETNIIENNRHSIQAWEKFRISPVESYAKAQSKIIPLLSLINNGLNAKNIVDNINNLRFGEGIYIIVAFSLLNICEQKAISKEWTNFFPVWAKKYHL